jgi:hypothetical protein
MRFTAERRLDDGVLERRFTLGGIPGILWTPGSASAPAPLILVGHPGGLHKTYPRLVSRARHSAAEGFAAATIELPGSGERPRSAAAEEARADLRRALEAGSSSRWSTRRSRNGRPLWMPSSRCPGSAARSGTRRSDLHRCPAGGGRAAHLGRPSVRRELRSRIMFEEARQVTLPVLVLLQRDDEGNDRQMALDLFEAFATEEKTLHASVGGHTCVPQFEGDDANRFFAGHLK